jgi:hypothetical protein
MINVAMHYVGAFSRLVGIQDEHYVLPGSATLRDLIGAIHARHEALAPGTFVAGDGTFSPLVVFMVQGSACRRQDAPLGSGTEVSVMALTPTVGG